MKSFYEFYRQMVNELAPPAPAAPGAPAAPAAPAVPGAPAAGAPAAPGATAPGAQQQAQPQNDQPLIDINASPGQVLEAAKKMVADPKMKQVLLAGLTDGNPQDEVVKITSGSKKARELTPTQAEIGSQQSLDDQIMDKFGGTMLAAGINGGKVPSKDGSFPILTFGNYILDGHHRWSQVYATNPEATLETAEISAPGIDNPTKALNLVHLILLSLYGKSITKDFQGQNLFKMKADDIRNYVLANIVDSTVQKLAQAGLISSPDKNEAAEMYVRNLEQLKNTEGKYPRLVMPQPLESGDKSAMTEAPPDAAQGKVNFNNPKVSDLQAAWSTNDGPTVMEQALILSGIVTTEDVENGKKKRRR